MEPDAFCPDCAYESDAEVFDTTSACAGKQNHFEGAGEVIGDVARFEDEHSNLCMDPWAAFNRAEGFKLASWFIDGKVCKTRINDYFISKKTLFSGQTERASGQKCVRSLRPVLPDLPCLLCLSSLASCAPGRPTFPPQRPTRLLRPHPLLVPPPCIRPLNLSSTGLLPTPCSCARPAAFSATLLPLAT